MAAAAADAAATATAAETLETATAAAAAAEESPPAAPKAADAVEETPPVVEAAQATEAAEEAPAEEEAKDKQPEDNVSPPKANAAGLLVTLPGEAPRHVPLPEKLLASPVGDVPALVRQALRETFGFDSDDGFRVLFRDRDIDEERWAEEFQKAVAEGPGPCALRVLFRLLGGKGGFGALLRKQGKMGKKTTNFDAQRDLSGRRLRHSKAVERIKEWMEQQKRDDELVKLITGEGPDLPKAPDPNDSLDPEYVRKLKRASGDRAKVVSEGMKRFLDKGEEAAADSDDEIAEEKSKRTRMADSDAGRGFFNALDALSSDSDDSDNGTKKGNAAAGSSAAASSSACAAAAADEDEGEDEEDEAEEEMPGFGAAAAAHAKEQQAKMRAASAGHSSAAAAADD